MELSFPVALAMAGGAYMLGHLLVRLFPVIEHHYLPEPVLGGLLIALTLLGLRLGDNEVEFPTSGLPLDILVATLTANMGLHVRPSVFRKGWRLFLVFLGLGAVLALGQLLLALPFAWFTDQPLQTAFIAGPLSLVGAPFNLNPPSQTGPLQPLFSESYPDLESRAQGVMMVSVLKSIFLAAFLGRKLEGRAGVEAPKPPRKLVDAPGSVAGIAHQQAIVVATLFIVIASAILLQKAMLQTIPGLGDDHVPIILLAYLLAALLRLTVETIRPRAFPERALTALLLGPTMSLVFGYAVMSLPLHHMGTLDLPLLLGALSGTVASAIAAWLGFSLFARLTDRYYAAVVATAFAAVTTAWGPIAMSYLRFFMREEGAVEPMPVVLPVNAFYLFPWMMIGLGHLLF